MHVGVVITAFFCGDYVVDAVRSLQLQDDPNWRCALVYDQREHGGLIDELTRNDERFTLVPSPVTNVCAARNLGYAAIDGDLLFALDGDDALEPQYVSTLRRLMRRPEVALAYTGTRFFGDTEGVKREYAYTPRLLAVRNMIVSSAMIRRRHFLEVGGYDERCSTAYEDWELWISLLKRGGEVAFCPRLYFKYRQRSGSRSHSVGLDAERAAKEYIFRKHSDFCWHFQWPRNRARCDW